MTPSWNPKPTPMTAGLEKQAVQPIAPQANLFAARPQATLGPYQTALSPQDEWNFRSWARTNNIPFPEKYKSIDEYINDPKADYDLRGYWQAQQAGNPMAMRAPNLHFPDYWKTPYHQTFSNESKYAGAGTPSWKDDKLISPIGSVLYDENKRKK